MLEILLVDDEQTVIDGLKLLVQWEELGIHHIRTCSNGKEALEAIHESKPDIMITDIKMPFLNGIELLRTLNNQNIQVKSIILSGYDDFEYVKEGIKCNVENYILKPVDQTEIMETLKQTVHKLELEEEESLAAVSNYDVVLKDNILNRAIRNQIDPKEFNERLKILNLDLISSTLQVGLMIPNIPADELDLSSMNILKESLFSALKSILPKGSFILFPNFEGQLVLILLIDYIPQYDLLLRKLMDEGSIGFRMAFSHKISHYRQLHLAYDSARKTSDYFMLRKNDLLLFADKINAELIQNNKTANIDYGKVEDLIVKGEKENLVSYIRKIYSELITTDQLSPNQIKIITMELFLIYHRIINGMNGSIYEIGDFPSTLIEDIHKAKSVDSLIQLSLSIISHCDDYLHTIINKQYSKTIQNVINYIHSHYDEEMSLKTLSHTLKLNSTYLGKKFRKEVGCLFGEYVNNVKMEKAQQLLMDSSLKISDISKMIGIYNTNYFYAMFKKHFNITPTEYRNRY